MPTPSRLALLSAAECPTKSASMMQDPASQPSSQRALPAAWRLGHQLGDSESEELCSQRLPHLGRHLPCQPETGNQ